MSVTPEQAATTADHESPAFPRLARVLAVVLMVDLVLMGAWLSPKMLATAWTASSLTLLVSATLMVLWMGAWIVRSRTRLVNDELTQTWIWGKQVSVADVASLKLVYIPWLHRVIAPRLLVRRRGGGMTWFHSADPELLLAFTARVAQRDLAGSQA